MKRLFAIALLLAGAAARAQSDVPQVTAHIQPDSVMIGDRFDLMVDVEKDLVQVVQFPEFEDKPGSAIELHKEHPVDTLERDGRHLKLRKRYTLAAFEEGKWNLGRPAVLYADKNIVDTLWTRDSLYLEVATFQIDSTSQSLNRFSNSFLWESFPMIARQSSGSLLPEVITTASLSPHTGRISRIRR